MLNDFLITYQTHCNQSQNKTNIFETKIKEPYQPFNHDHQFPDINQLEHQIKILISVSI